MKIEEIKKEIQNLVPVQNNDKHNKAVLRLLNFFDEYISTIRREAIEGFIQFLATVDYGENPADSYLKNKRADTVEHYTKKLEIYLQENKQ